MDTIADVEKLRRKITDRYEIAEVQTSVLEVSDDLQKDPVLPK